MAAMQWAGDLASDIGVPVVLAHVVEPVVVPPRWQALVTDFESERVAFGQRMLARLSASFRDAHSECVVSVGRPADTIASLAVENGAGLVVMGLANAEDSELRKPGSIAYRVLRIAMLRSLSCLALRRELRSIGPASGRAVNRSSIPDRLARTLILHRIVMRVVNDLHFFAMRVRSAVGTDRSQMEVLAYSSNEWRTGVADSFLGPNRATCRVSQNSA